METSLRSATRPCLVANPARGLHARRATQAALWSQRTLSHLRHPCSLPVPSSNAPCPRQFVGCRVATPNGTNLTGDFAVDSDFDELEAVEAKLKSQQEEKAGAEGAAEEEVPVSETDAEVPVEEQEARPPPDLPFSIGDVVVGRVIWSGQRGAKIELVDFEGYTGFCPWREFPLPLIEESAQNAQYTPDARKIQPGLMREFQILDIPNDIAPGGRGPLLAARRLDRDLMWARLEQMTDITKYERENLGFFCIGVNEGGLRGILAGYPVFMPRSHVYKEYGQPALTPEEIEEKYVGKRNALGVSVLSLDHSRGRVVVSERVAYQNKKLRNLGVGSLIEGEVRQITGWGAFVNIERTQVSGLLHISNVSQAMVQRMEDVFQVGDRVTAVIISMQEDFQRISLSTADLEKNSGDMLTDKEMVFQTAPEMAKVIAEEIEEQKRAYLEQVEQNSGDPYY